MKQPTKQRDTGRWPSRRIFLAALLVVLSPALGARAGADSVIELSWHRPLGQPRSSAFIAPACGDSAREDTLFLTFELEHPRPALTSVRGAILFNPRPGDSLGTYWQLKTGWPNGGGIHIEFPPFATAYGAVPWQETGVVELDYDHRSGRGRLDFHYAAPALPNGNGLEPGVRYVLARIRLLHRGLALTGCAKPVCVEWPGLRLVYATGREEEITRGKDRFLNWYGEGACSAYRAGTPGRTWVPRTR